MRKTHGEIRQNMQGQCGRYRLGRQNFAAYACPLVGRPGMLPAVVSDEGWAVSQVPPDYIALIGRLVRPQLCVGMKA